MKQFLFAAALSGSVLSGQAQAQTETAKDIPAVEQEQLSKSVYADKLQENVSRLAVNNGNTNAWVNAYKAERYSNYTATSRSISPASQQKLDFMVEQMESAIPGTYEFHYASYLNGNKSPDAMQHLRQASALNPGAVELYDDMLAMAVIEKNQSRVKEFAQKLSDARIYSPAELEYNNNVLASVSPGAILITHGNVDTYPLIISQQLNAIRTDVKIICLDWLGSSVYREQVAQMCGIAKGKISIDASSTLASILSGSNEKIYLALTLPPSELKKHAPNLYLNGLAFLYSEQEQANLPDLASKWEIYFSKAHIDDNEAINRNYILALVLLSAYYEDTGQHEKKKTVDQLAKQLAALTTNPSIVNQYID